MDNLKQMKLKYQKLLLLFTFLLKQ